MVKKRLTIYAKDIVRITGMSERNANRLLARIRQKLNKAPDHLVTVKEFCDSKGLSEHDVHSYLD